MIKCGDKVKDKITGLTGIVISRTEWLNSCVRLQVQPQEVKDGKPVESTVFDEEQLEIVGEGILAGIKKAVQTGGGRDDRAALKR